MRLFAAAELPADVRGALAAWGASLGDPRLRPVTEASLHLTLVFLGERPSGEAAVLGAAVVGCVDGPVVVRLGGPLWLAPRRPHVLTVGVDDPSGALAALQARVAGALDAAGAGGADERRAWLAHVTVARVRGGAGGAGIRPKEVTLPPVPAVPAFAVPAVALLRSHLGGGPARYEAVARRTLPLARCRGAAPGGGAADR